METLFESRYVRNRQWAKEAYSYIMFKQKPLVVCYILLAPTLVANVLLQNWGVSAFILGFCAVVVLNYFRVVKMITASDAELHDGEITVETVVTETYIQNTNAIGTVHKIEFHNIKKAAQTKNFIILQTKARMVLTIGKNTFTKGTLEEFLTFLKSKGFKV